MKGLILSGGAGTRLRPITHTSAKQLVPIANKPILFYGIEDMVAAGITDIGIIVGDTGDEIRAAVGDGAALGAAVTYISQDEPLGLAHCVLIARDFLGEDDFVMYLGDNMLEQGLAEFVEGFEAGRRQAAAPRLGEEAAPPAAQILLAEVDDPRSFGVAEIGPDGEVLRLVEKPDVLPSNLALVGVYLFDAHVHDAVRAIEPSERGELEITDAIQWLIDQGHRVRHEVLSGWWIDTGKKDPLLDCNRLILEKLEARIDGEVDEASRLDGRVVVEAGAQVVGSTVRGPVIIGAGTKVVDSYIGPFTSVAANCEVTESEVEHSVILEGSRIAGIDRAIDSLVGRDVSVSRTRSKPRALRLMLGDHSHVEVEMAEVTLSEVIEGVFVAEPDVHGDERGLFVETYRRSWFPGGREMIQANRADRAAGALVGLHYHLHQADYRYVPFGRARVVLHDLRQGGPTDGATLTMDLGRQEDGSHSHRGVYIPPGVAHGFAALTDLTITYLVDGYYNGADELGVAWDDPEICADWGVSDPVLSERDRTNPRRVDIEAVWRLHPALRT